MFWKSKTSEPVCFEQRVISCVVLIEQVIGFCVFIKETFARVWKNKHSAVLKEQVFSLVLKKEQTVKSINKHLYDYRKPQIQTDWWVCDVTYLGSVVFSFVDSNHPRCSTKEQMSTVWCWSTTTYLKYKSNV